MNDALNLSELNKIPRKMFARSLEMHCWGPALCNVVIDVTALLVPLHVVLIDQSTLVSTIPQNHKGNFGVLLNVLLDVRRIQHASSLRCRNDFTDQLRMRNALPALHDPNNRRLCLVIAIRSYAFVGLLILLFSLFGLNLVDLDAIPWVGKVEIHGEGIGVVDVFTPWLFVEDAVLSASKGLERPLEFGVV